MTVIRGGGPVVMAWSAVSPFGIGADPFGSGVRAGVPAQAGPGAGGGLVRSVPDFDARALLGRKGTRSMDRVTALAVTAVGRLLGPDAWRPPAPGGPVALVLGTTMGSARSTMDFTRDSITGDRPHLVDPARFPNTVMNCAAGLSAIRYGLKGPNATVAGGRAAGLLALNYARRLQRGGRAHTVLCGGAEEYSAARGWLRRHALGPDGDGTPAGEGCAVLHLEPSHAPEAGEHGLAEVAALEFGVAAGPGEVRSVLASCLRRALASGPFAPSDVWAAATGGPAEAGDPERAAVADVLGRTPPVRISCADLVGDTSAAAATLQIAAVLSTARRTPAAVGRTALVTSADRDGTVGCALLRLLPGAVRGWGVSSK
ncbi:beta-ketoacyl synthase N-terminal-like domain-containing protein [Streptomyces jumonjinensis]|uniref:beta-ketoacyl synthase N-terminal-like domain-containing protein n=1 Tax=Streptomyces jumonjinensis TaxID=1945 RepID=UPI0037BC3FC2